jgi:hypothetical protein
MSDACVMLVSRNGPVIERFLHHLGQRPGVVLRVAAALGGLEDQQRGPGRTVIVAQVDDETDRAAMERLLEAQAGKHAQRDTAVVALVGQYNEDEAARLFRQGVTEYLSLRDHGDRLVEIVSLLLNPTTGSPRRPLALGAMGRRRESRVTGRLHGRVGRLRYRR